MYHYEMNEQVLKREKAAARELRKSRWWQIKIACQAKCNYCLKSLTKDECTMDHVVPMVRGGRSTKGNVVIACKDCNNLKKDRLVMDWIPAQAGTVSESVAHVGTDSAATGLHEPSHRDEEKN
jgi:5-methylcytosine-specific restriction enzyme A